MALDFFAGCIGGCAGVIVGHPLDTVKVQLQTQDPRNPRYRGAIDCLRQITAREGARGLYRGMSSPLSGVAAINAVVFGIYGNSQRNFRNPDALTTHLVAGTCAGIAQSFLCAPMELVKLQAQVSPTQMAPLDCLKKTFKSEGWRGLYRGYGITVAREIPGFSTYFVSYEYLSRNTDGSPPSTVKMLFAGGAAGVISWTFSYPIDMLKTRLQLDGLNGVKQYKDVMDCLRQGLKAEGHSFLFRGMGPTLVRAFPVNAATFTVVHWTMRLVHGDFHVPPIRVEIQKGDIAIPA